MKYLKTYEEKKGVTFKEWLKKYPQDINTNKIDCRRENLINLDGIKEFKNLQSLFCGGNNLTSLNLEGLDKLEYLDCNYNNLTSLGLDNLKVLWCYNNKLSNLDLEALDKLKYLDCYDNNLPYNDLDGYWKWWEKEYPERVEAKKFNF